jgi:hypothetical protein
MADKRIQQYPAKASPSSNDYVLLADSEDVDVNGYLKYKKAQLLDLAAGLIVTYYQQITRDNLLLKINNSELDTSKFYLITDINIPLLIQASRNNILSEIGVSNIDGQVYKYNITTNVAQLYTPNTSFIDLTDGVTITLDFSLGENFSVTLGGNRTLAFSNLADGDSGVLFIIQDAIGGRTLTLPANSKVLNNGSGVLALTTTANGIDVVAFIKKGTNIIFSLNKNAN